MSPRTLEQNLELRKHKEELIISAALKLFSENGFLGTSMQNISKEAGVSKGNLYNYFESKDDLLRGVLKQGVNEFTVLLGSYSGGLNNTEDFEKAIRGNFKLLKSNNKYWKLYFNILTQPQSQLLFQELFAPFLAEYLRIFESYFKVKGDANPHVTSMLLGSTLDGISLGYLMMGDLYPLDNVLDELIEKFK